MIDLLLKEEERARVKGDPTVSRRRRVLTKAAERGELNWDLILKEGRIRRKGGIWDVLPSEPTKAQPREWGVYEKQWGAVVLDAVWGQ